MKLNPTLQNLDTVYTHVLKRKNKYRGICTLEFTLHKQRIWTKSKYVFLYNAVLIYKEKDQQDKTAQKENQTKEVNQ